jgi:hypothetical protein
VALSIGVVPGSRIMIGKSVVLVNEILNSNLVSLSVDGGPAFMVSDQERTQIAPEVMVFCGVKKPRNDSHVSRLAFEAPRNIIITKVEDGARG